MQEQNPLHGEVVPGENLAELLWTGNQMHIQPTEPMMNDNILINVTDI